MLDAEAVFSYSAYSTEAPSSDQAYVLNPETIERLTSLVPNYFLLERTRNNLLTEEPLSRPRLEPRPIFGVELLNRVEAPDEILIGTIRPTVDRLRPRYAETIDELMLLSRQIITARVEEAIALRQEAIEEAMNRYVLAEDFPEDKIEIFHNFIRYSASSEIIDARLSLNERVSYEIFLSAVSLALAVTRNYDSAHALPFVENVLEPLSHDLKTREYRGYRFTVRDLPVFFRRVVADLEAFEIKLRTERQNEGLWFPVPDEIKMAQRYSQTFWFIHENKLVEALNLRPHDFDSDEEHYPWFLFLQAELRYAGHVAFADQIMETELEHYRELIVWQLQMRAYLAQRLYETGDSISLSTLKNLLAHELANLRSNTRLNLSFEKALDDLRAIDYMVLEASHPNTFNGAVILPWINRQVIDRRMGRHVVADRWGNIRRWGNFRNWSGYATLEDWKRVRESMEEENIVDNETKETMQKLFRWILSYIRALAIASERLYAESSLEEMTQLHSKLMNSRNINNIRDWGSEHLLRRRFINDEQRRFDIRRFYFIAGERGFWNHQRRRQNGDMTVGDIILPWVEVRDYWFENEGMSEES